MAQEGKGIALAILGIVAVIAVVGLVLLFTGVTGKYAVPTDKLYGGGGVTRGGQDQYHDGFVRYVSNRPEYGALYSYDYSDEFRSRIQDSGDQEVPYATYDASYKRTGPIMDNPCPYSPYTDRVTRLYAQGRECVPSEMPNYEDFLCCI